MPIHFRCSACNRRLSIATRKAGMQTPCPSCKAVVTVPGTPAPAEAPPYAHGRLFPVAILAGGVLLLVASIVLALVVALRKPAQSGMEQVRTDPPANAPANTPPTLTVPPTPPSLQQPNLSAPKPSQPAPAPQPKPAVEPLPNLAPPVQPPRIEQPAEAPPPHVVVKPPPQRPPLDRFGNPVGHDIGLGHDNEFKGKKLLFWSGFENAGRVFFHPTNPLWKALEEKGFTVRREFGKFKPEWLKETDQLWILSTGRIEIPAGITPDLLVDAVSLLPVEAIPSGFTVVEYQFIVKATLDVALSRTHPLEEKDYKAIVDFVKAGKGLCLLADDEPFTKEADELAKRLFGVRVTGNYLADKVATVKGRGLAPAELRKFGAQYEVDDHPLLTGVNFLFEGITVSNISKSDKLDVAIRASDGQALVVVSKVPGVRVVIDCGFTRYCHGPDARVSYILKTAGTVRLGQNIAAYLAGNDKPKKP